MFLFQFFLLLLTISHLQANEKAASSKFDLIQEDANASTPEEIVALLSERDRLIGGVVSPLSGAPCLREVDLIAKGAENVILSRTYIAPFMIHSFDDDESVDKYKVLDLFNKTYRGWVFFPHIRLKQKKDKVCVFSPYGAVLHFQVKDDKTSLIDETYGISNFAHDTPSGKYDPRNTQINLKGDLILVRTSEGHLCHYIHAKDEIYLLEKEILPNGKILRFSYNRYGDLTRVESRDSTDQYSYACIDLKTGFREYHSMTNSGIAADYTYEIRHQADKTRFDGIKKEYSLYAKPLLTHVKSPFCNKKIEYSPRFLLGKFDSQYDKFMCTYEGFKKDEKEKPHCRVKTLSVPSFKAWQTVYTIEYDPAIPDKKSGSATAQNCDGTKTIYNYTKKLLLKDVQHFSDNGKLKKKTVFHWSKSNKLLSLELLDGHDQVLCKRTFAYDRFKNPKKEKITGDLCGSGTQENYFISREFSKDGLHLLLKEEAEEHPTLIYEYLPDTNLVTSKLLKDGDNVLKRELFEYDACKNLIKHITHQGTSHSIVEYTPRQEYPFIHMPEWVNEKYVENGTEKLLKRRHFAYDIHGNICEEQIYDATGKLAYTLLREHNERGDILSETNALSQKATYAYDQKGHCTFASTFSQNLKKEMSYDSQGNLEEQKEIGIDGIVHTTSYRYDPNNRLIKKTDSFGNTAHYDYDCIVDKVIRTESPSIRSLEGNAIPVFTYAAFDALGREVSKIDANGNVTNTRYNLYGSPSEISHPDGSKEQFRYSKNGHLKQHIDREGLTINYQRDLLGRILSKEYVSSNNEIIGHVSFTYDGSNVLTETDLEGNLTRYEYDGAGRKTKEDRSGKVTQFYYDALGRVGEVHRENGTNATHTLFTYDLLDHVLKKQITDQSGKLLYQIEYTYDAEGNVATTTRYVNGQKAVENNRYDSFNRQIEYIDALGNATRTKYYEKARNSLFQIVLETRTVDPQNVTTIETYDPYDRKISTEIQNPSKSPISSQTTTYDACGNILQQKDCIYQGEKHVSTQVTRYTYTPTHCIATSTRAYGTSDSRTTSFTYTPYGNVTTKTNPNGTTLTYAYDPLGYLASLQSSDGSISYKYTYNHRGELLEASDNINHTKIQRKLDASGNILREQFSTGLVIEKTYDHFDRPLSIAIPGHGSIRYTYGPLHLNKVERLTANGEVTYAHEYEKYDLNGHLIKEHLIANVDRITHCTDCKGRKSKSFGTSFLQESQYDQSDNLVATSIDGLDYHYGYDHLDQLTLEEGVGNSQIQAYDSNYNCIKKNGQTTEVNNLNELLTCDDITCSYDLNGNIVTKTTPHETFSFKYDALNQLVEADTNNQQLRLIYDPLGRQLSKISHSRGTSGTYEKTVEHYLYSGENEIGAFTSNGKAKQLRVLGLSLHENVPATVAVEIEDKIYAPIQDVQGNIRRLIDVNSKQKYEYDYTAFGEELGASEVFNPWGYAGKRLDADLGLVNFGKRYYDPALARWLTTDPAGFVDGMNLYAYLKNNPFRYVDPDGRLAFVIPILIATIETTGFTLAFPSLATIGWTAAGTAIGAAGAYFCKDLAHDIDQASKVYATNKMYREFNNASNADDASNTGKEPKILDPNATGAQTRPQSDDLVRFGPRNLEEQITLEEAEAGAGDRIMKDDIKDPHYPKDKWKKVEHIHKGPKGNIEIHYWEDLVTGARHGFKFKN